MNRNFSNAIENWYKEYKRELPWRDSADPYVIWISEIILQQTRVVQGYDYFVRFMKRFPDVATLAEADEDEVMKYWQGLGYYSRARNLHAAAKSMNGVFPKTYPEVRALKGVGEYTAAAICSFAYNMPYAVVDGNVYRVLSRYLGIDTPIDSTEGKKMFAAVADELLDRKNPHYTIRLLWTSERSNVLLKLPTACFVRWLTVVRRWQRGQWRSFRSSSTK